MTARGILRSKRFPLRFQHGDQRLELGHVCMPALVGDGTVDGHYLADGGDFAAAAAAAVTARGSVVIAAVEQQALGFPVSIERAVKEARWRIGCLAHEVETYLQSVEQFDILLLGAQGARAANVDAFEAASAFPRIDRRREQAARARRRFFHDIEKWAGSGYRIDSEDFDQLAEVGEQAGLPDRQAGGDLGNDFMEGARVAGLAVNLTDALGHRDDLGA